MGPAPRQLLAVLLSALLLPYQPLLLAAAESSSSSSSNDDENKKQDNAKKQGEEADKKKEDEKNFEEEKKQNEQARDQKSEQESGKKDGETQGAAASKPTEGKASAERKENPGPEVPYDEFKQAADAFDINKLDAGELQKLLDMADRVKPRKPQQRQELLRMQNALLDLAPFAINIPAEQAQQTQTAIQGVAERTRQGVGLPAGGQGQGASASLQPEKLNAFYTGAQPGGGAAQAGIQGGVPIGNRSGAGTQDAPPPAGQRSALPANFGNIDRNNLPAPGQTAPTAPPRSGAAAASQAAAPEQTSPMMAAAARLPNPLPFGSAVARTTQQLAKDAAFRTQDERLETQRAQSAAALLGALAKTAGTPEDVAQARKLREGFDSTKSEADRKAWLSGAERFLEGAGGRHPALSREKALFAELERLDKDVKAKVPGADAQYKAALNRLGEQYAANPELKGYRQKAYAHEKFVSDALKTGTIPDGREFAAADFGLATKDGKAFTSTVDGQRGLAFRNKGGDWSFTSMDGRTQIDNGSGGGERRDFDAQGRLARATEARGEEMTERFFSRDAQGRVTGQAVLESKDGKPTGLSEIAYDPETGKPHTVVEKSTDGKATLSTTKIAADGTFTTTYPDDPVTRSGKVADGKFRVDAIEKKDADGKLEFRTELGPNGAYKTTFPKENRTESGTITGGKYVPNRITESDGEGGSTDRRYTYDAQGRVERQNVFESKDGRITGRSQIDYDPATGQARTIRELTPNGKALSELRLSGDRFERTDFEKNVVQSGRIVDGKLVQTESLEKDKDGNPIQETRSDGDSVEIMKRGESLAKGRMVDGKFKLEEATLFKEQLKIRPLNDVATEIADMKGERMAVQLDTKALLEAKTPEAREEAIQRLSAALVQASASDLTERIGKRDPALLEKTLSAWLKEAAPSADTGDRLMDPESIRLMSDRHGNISLSSQYDGGFTIRETASFRSDSTPIKGKKLGPALVTTAKTYGGKDDMPRELRRSEEYLLTGDRLAWKDNIGEGTPGWWKTATGDKHGDSWRLLAGLNRITHSEIQHQRLGEDGSWEKLSEERKSTQSQRVPGNSASEILGQLWNSSIPGIAGKSLYNLVGGVPQSVVGAAGEMFGGESVGASYRLHGEMAMRRATFGSEQQLAKDLQFMGPTQKAMLTMHAQKERARELKEAGLTPERIGQKEFDERVSQNMSDSDLAKYGMGTLGMGNYGRWLGGEANDSAGWKKTGLGIAAFSMHFAEQTGESLPLLLGVGALGRIGAANLAPNASLAARSGVYSSQVAHDVLGTYLGASWSASIPKATADLLHAAHVGDVAAMAESGATGLSNLLFAGQAARGLVRSDSAPRSAPEVKTRDLSTDARNLLYERPADNGYASPRNSTRANQEFGKLSSLEAGERSGAWSRLDDLVRRDPNAVRDIPTNVRNALGELFRASPEAVSEVPSAIRSHLSKIDPALFSGLPAKAPPAAPNSAEAGRPVALLNGPVEGSRLPNGRPAASPSNPPNRPLVPGTPEATAYALYKNLLADPAFKGNAMEQAAAVAKGAPLPPGLNSFRTMVAAGMDVTQAMLRSRPRAEPEKPSLSPEQLQMEVDSTMNLRRFSGEPTPDFARLMSQPSNPSRNGATSLDAVVEASNPQVPMGKSEITGSREVPKGGAPEAPAAPTAPLDAVLAASNQSAPTGQSYFSKLFSRMFDGKAEQGEAAKTPEQKVELARTLIKNAEARKRDAELGIQSDGFGNNMSTPIRGRRAGERRAYEKSSYERDIAKADQLLQEAAQERAAREKAAAEPSLFEKILERSSPEKQLFEKILEQPVRPREGAPATELMTATPESMVGAPRPVASEPFAELLKKSARDVAEIGDYSPRQVKEGAANVEAAARAYPELGVVEAVQRDYERRRVELPPEDQVDPEDHRAREAGLRIAVGMDSARTWNGPFYSINQIAYGTLDAVNRSLNGEGVLHAKDIRTSEAALGLIVNWVRTNGSPEARQGLAALEGQGDFQKYFPNIGPISRAVNEDIQAVARDPVKLKQALDPEGKGDADRDIERLAADIRGGRTSVSSTLPALRARLDRTFRRNGAGWAFGPPPVRTLDTASPNFVPQTLFRDGINMGLYWTRIPSPVHRERANDLLALKSTGKNYRVSLQVTGGVGRVDYQEGRIGAQFEAGRLLPGGMSRGQIYSADFAKLYERALLEANNARYAGGNGAPRLDLLEEDIRSAPGGILKLSIPGVTVTISDIAQEPTKANPNPADPRSYGSIPESFRAGPERDAQEVARQAAPEALSKKDVLQDGDPALFSDHSKIHGMHTTENVPVVLDAAFKSGLISPRPAERREIMQRQGMAGGVIHDRWMKDLTPEGRKLHPHRAARDAFSPAMDQPTQDLLAEGLGQKMRRVYGVPALEVPRVEREILATLAFGHSKSNVPLETLNDPVALRETMKDLIGNAPPAEEVPFRRFYQEKGREAFDAKAFDWITNNPNLSADITDAARALRLADALRPRGYADFRGSQGAPMGAAEIDGKVRSFTRLSDPETGKTYMLVGNSKYAIGEYNTRHTRLSADGRLELGIQKGDYSTPENNRVVAEATAHIFLDVWNDFAGSFKGAADRSIVIERPAKETAGFTESVVEELAKKDPRLKKLKDAGKIVIQASSDKPLPANLAAEKAEIERFERARPADLKGAALDRFIRSVEAGGVDTNRIDFSRGLRGARIVTLAPEETLVAKGTAGNFVYIPLEGAETSIKVGRGYKPSPVPVGVPIAELSAISNNPRGADIQGEGNFLALPKETYAEWSHAYYDHDALLARLKRDYPLRPSASESPLTRALAAPLKALAQSGGAAADTARVLMQNALAALRGEPFRSGRGGARGARAGLRDDGRGGRARGARNDPYWSALNSDRVNRLLAKIPASMGGEREAVWSQLNRNRGDLLEVPPKIEGLLRELFRREPEALEEIPAPLRAKLDEIAPNLLGGPKAQPAESPSDGRVAGRISGPVLKAAPELAPVASAVAGAKPVRIPSFAKYEASLRELDLSVPEQRAQAELLDRRYQREYLRSQGYPKGVEPTALRILDRTRQGGTDGTQYDPKTGAVEINSGRNTADHGRIIVHETRHWQDHVEIHIYATADPAGFFADVKQGIIDSVMPDSEIYNPGKEEWFRIPQISAPLLKDLREYLERYLLEDPGGLDDLTNEIAADQEDIIGRHGEELGRWAVTRGGSANDYFDAAFILDRLLEAQQVRLERVLKTARMPDAAQTPETRRYIERRVREWTGGQNHDARALARSRAQDIDGSLAAHRGTSLIDYVLSTMEIRADSQAIHAEKARRRSDAGEKLLAELFGLPRFRPLQQRLHARVTLALYTVARAEYWRDPAKEGALDPLLHEMDSLMEHLKEGRIPPNSREPLKAELSRDRARLGLPGPDPAILAPGPAAQRAAEIVAPKTGGAERLDSPPAPSLEGATLPPDRAVVAAAESFRKDMKGLFPERLTGDFIELLKRLPMDEAVEARDRVVRAAERNTTAIDRATELKGFTLELMRRQRVREQKLEEYAPEASWGLTSDYTGYTMRGGRRVAKDFKAGEIDNDIPLVDGGKPRIYESKGSLRPPRGGEKETAAMNQMLKYQAAIDSGKVAGATIEITGRVDRQLLGWAFAAVPDIEFIYELPLPGGGNHRFVLKAPRRGRGLRFLREAAPADPRGQRVVEGVKRALRDGTILELLDPKVDLSNSSPVLRYHLKRRLPFDDYTLVEEMEDLWLRQVHKLLKAEAAQVPGMLLAEAPTAGKSEAGLPLSPMAAKYAPRLAALDSGEATDPRPLEKALLGFSREHLRSMGYPEGVGPLDVVLVDSGRSHFFPTDGLMRISREDLGARPGNWEYLVRHEDQHFASDTELEIDVRGDPKGTWAEVKAGLIDAVVPGKAIRAPGLPGDRGVVPNFSPALTRDIKDLLDRSLTLEDALLPRTSLDLTGLDALARRHSAELEVLDALQNQDPSAPARKVLPSFLTAQKLRMDQIVQAVGGLINAPITSKTPQTRAYIAERVRDRKAQPLADRRLRARDLARRLDATLEGPDGVQSADYLLSDHELRGRTGPIVERIAELGVELVERALQPELSLALYRVARERWQGGAGNRAEYEHTVASVGGLLEQGRFDYRTDGLAGQLAGDRETLASAPPAQADTRADGILSHQEALGRFKRDPMEAYAQGEKLGGTHGARKVELADGPWVMKKDDSGMRNEVMAHRLVREFFEHFDSPETLGYRREDGRGMVLSRYDPLRRTDRRSYAAMPRERKAEAGVGLLGYGMMDLASRNVLHGADGPALIDFGILEREPLRITPELASELLEEGRVPFIEPDGTIDAASLRAARERAEERTRRPDYDRKFQAAGEYAGLSPEEIRGYRNAVRENFKAENFERNLAELQRAAAARAAPEAPASEPQPGRSLAPVEDRSALSGLEAAVEALVTKYDRIFRDKRLDPRHEADRRAILDLLDQFSVEYLAAIGEDPRVIPPKTTFGQESHSSYRSTGIELAHYFTQHRRLDSSWAGTMIHELEHFRQELTDFIGMAANKRAWTEDVKQGLIDSVRPGQLVYSPNLKEFKELPPVSPELEGDLKAFLKLSLKTGLEEAPVPAEWLASARRDLLTKHSAELARLRNLGYESPDAAGGMLDYLSTLQQGRLDAVLDETIRMQPAFKRETWRHIEEQARAQKGRLTQEQRAFARDMALNLEGRKRRYEKRTENYVFSAIEIAARAMDIVANPLSRDGKPLEEALLPELRLALYRSARARYLDARTPEWRRVFAAQWRGLRQAVESQEYRTKFTPLIRQELSRDARLLRRSHLAAAAEALGELYDSAADRVARWLPRSPARQPVPAPASRWEEAFPGGLDGVPHGSVRSMLEAIRDVERSLNLLPGAVVVYGGGVRDLLHPTRFRTELKADIDILVRRDPAKSLKDAAEEAGRVVERLEKRLGFKRGALARRESELPGGLAVDYLGEYDDQRIYPIRGLEQYLGKIQESSGTMALRSDGRILDPHGARRDMAENVVRFVGDGMEKANHETVLRAVRIKHQDGARYDERTRDIVQNFFTDPARFPERAKFESWLEAVRRLREYREARANGDSRKAAELAARWLEKIKEDEGPYPIFGASYVEEFDAHIRAGEYDQAARAFHIFMYLGERYPRGTETLVEFNGFKSPHETDVHHLGVGVREVLVNAKDPAAAAAELRSIGIEPFLDAAGIDLQDLLTRSLAYRSARARQEAALAAVERPAASVVADPPASEGPEDAARAWTELETTRGKADHVIQDVVLADADRGVLIVADGYDTFGHKAAEIAKNLADADLKRRLTPQTTPKEARQMLLEIIPDANAALKAYVKAHPEAAGAGAAFSIAIAVTGRGGRKVLVTGGVGDASILVRRANGRLDDAGVDESAPGLEREKVLAALENAGVDRERVERTGRVMPGDLKSAKAALDDLAQRLPFFNDLLDEARRSGRPLNLRTYEIHPSRHKMANSLGDPGFKFDESNIRQTFLDEGDIVLGASDAAADNLGQLRMGAVARVADNPKDLVQLMAFETARVSAAPRPGKEKARAKKDDIGIGAFYVGENPPPFRDLLARRQASIRRRVEDKKYGEASPLAAATPTPAAPDTVRPSLERITELRKKDRFQEAARLASDLAAEVLAKNPALRRAERYQGFEARLAGGNPGDALIYFDQLIRDEISRLIDAAKTPDEAREALRRTGLDAFTEYLTDEDPIDLVNLHFLARARNEAEAAASAVEPIALGGEGNPESYRLTAPKGGVQIRAGSTYLTLAYEDGRWRLTYPTPEGLKTANIVGSLTVGRGEGSTLAFDDKLLSRGPNLEIAIDGDSAVLRDLGSRNGAKIYLPSPGGAHSATQPLAAQEQPSRAPSLAAFLWEAARGWTARPFSLTRAVLGALTGWLRSSATSGERVPRGVEGRLRKMIQTREAGNHGDAARLASGLLQELLRKSPELAASKHVDAFYDAQYRNDAPATLDAFDRFIREEISKALRASKAAGTEGAALRSLGLDPYLKHYGIARPARKADVIESMAKDKAAADGELKPGRPVHIGGDSGLKSYKVTAPKGEIDLKAGRTDMTLTYDGAAWTLRYPEGSATAERAVTGSVSIGRGRANDIRIDDPKMSRQVHLLISVKGDTAEFQDLGSRNGTRISLAPPLEPLDDPDLPAVEEAYAAGALRRVLPKIIAQNPALAEAFARVKEAGAQLTSMERHRLIAEAVQNYLLNERGVRSSLQESPDGTSYQVFIDPSSTPAAKGAKRDYLVAMSEGLRRNWDPGVEVGFDTRNLLKGGAHFQPKSAFGENRILLSALDLFSPRLTPVGGHEVRHFIRTAAKPGRLPPQIRLHGVRTTEDGIAAKRGLYQKGFTTEEAADTYPFTIEGLKQQSAPRASRGPVKSRPEPPADLGGYIAELEAIHGELAGAAASAFEKALAPGAVTENTLKSHMAAAENSWDRSVALPGGETFWFKSKQINDWAASQGLKPGTDYSLDPAFMRKVLADEASRIREALPEPSSTAAPKPLLTPAPAPRAPAAPLKRTGFRLRDFLADKAAQALAWILPTEGPGYLAARMENSAAEAAELTRGTGYVRRVTGSIANDPGGVAFGVFRADTADGPAALKVYQQDSAVTWDRLERFAVLQNHLGELGKAPRVLGLVPESEIARLRNSDPTLRAARGRSEPTFALAMQEFPGVWNLTKSARIPEEILGWDRDAIAEQIRELEDTLNRIGIATGDAQVGITKAGKAVLLDLDFYHFVGPGENGESSSGSRTRNRFAESAISDFDDKYAQALSREAQRKRERARYIERNLERREAKGPDFPRQGHGIDQDSGFLRAEHRRKIDEADRNEVFQLQQEAAALDRRAQELNAPRRKEESRSFQALVTAGAAGLLSTAIISPKFGEHAADIATGGAAAAISNSLFGWPPAAILLGAAAIAPWVPAARRFAATWVKSLENEDGGSAGNLIQKAAMGPDIVFGAATMMFLSSPVPMPIMPPILGSYAVLRGAVFFLGNMLPGKERAEAPASPWRMSLASALLYMSLLGITFRAGAVLHQLPEALKARAVAAAYDRELAKLPEAAPQDRLADFTRHMLMLDLKFRPTGRLDPVLKFMKPGDPAYDAIAAKATPWTDAELKQLEKTLFNQGDVYDWKEDLRPIARFHAAYLTIAKDPAAWSDPDAVYAAYLKTALPEDSAEIGRAQAAVKAARTDPRSGIIPNFLPIFAALLGWFGADAWLQRSRRREENSEARRP